jgi:two-component system, sensor histidine kinase and response regulator
MSHLKTHIENLAREISTPLNFLLSATERLLDSRLSAEERQAVERLRSSAEVFRKASEEFLSNSRLQAIELSLDPVDLRVRGAVSGMPQHSRETAP